jgi:hypothetical protein
MEIENQIKLSFIGVDIIKVDFTSLQSVYENHPEVKTAADAKVYYPKENQKILMF